MAKKIILDTSAFLSGFDLTKNNQYVTTTEVYSELKNEITRLSAGIAVEEGWLKIIHPSKQNMKAIEIKVMETGEQHSLSNADKSILAAALEEKENGADIEIVTDDYGIQNVAKQLSLNYTPILEKGIKKQINWHFVCRGCGSTFEKNILICNECGNPVKKRSKRE